MKGEFIHLLVANVTNPGYRGACKRGLWSVREFRAGLALIVHRVPDITGNFYSWARISIDIPVLRVRGINDLLLINKLLAASKQTYGVGLPVGETFVVCPRCRGTLWHNITRAAGYQIPLRSLCAACGTDIKLVRLDHAPGHA